MVKASVPHMRLLTILQSDRALSASWAQPRYSTISYRARTRRPADCVMKTMSTIRAKPSSFSWEMYACSSTFTCAKPAKPTVTKRIMYREVPSTQ